MVLGIGVDSVTISEMRGIVERMSHGGLRKLFTDQEVIESEKHQNSAVYLATRFAVKEAVFKAVAHLTEEKTFDLRIVETHNHSDGSPYVNKNKALEKVLHAAGVQRLHVSITTEGDLATAFVIAETTD